MHHLVSKITNYFFPSLCVHCRVEGQWLCTTAQKEISTLPVLLDPILIQGVDRVVCRGDYDRPILGNIIQRVKYDFWTAPAHDIFPNLIADLLPVLQEVSHETTIVPIPLHWRRQMSRGFNQSVLIADAISGITGLPVTRLLLRQRFTQPQAKLNGQQRLSNVAKAFRVQPVAKMSNSVILVDDVITTGSTIRECASVLRQAGVKTIIAVALAKG